MENTFHIIGLMSGTSLDGLDLAYCRFAEKDGHWHYELVKTQCIAYHANWCERLQELPNESAQKLAQTHADFGLFLGTHVRAFIEEHGLKPDLISSHGHTVFHQPENHLAVQIGDGAAIEALTNVPVVSNFRTADVYRNGEGAPLVPIGDQLLFPEYAYLLNLGGIANISFDEYGKRKAFDISPCNLLLNCLAREDGKVYDDKGEMAASGKMNEDLLAKLNGHPYFRLPPPKSLDKRYVEEEFYPIFQKAHLNLPDKAATAAELIAIHIGAASGPGKMLVTGGGAFNLYLLSRIRAHSQAEIIIPNEELLKFKEALVFAFLGLLRVLNRPNILGSYTGSNADSIAGALWGDFSRFC